MRCKKKQKALLIQQGARLMVLGIKLEHARNRLRRLNRRGVPYSGARMLKANGRFNALCVKWQKLEEGHLRTKDSFREK